MAINIVEYNMIRVLRRVGLLPLGGDLLELGETNWSGDVDLDTFRQDIAEFAAPDRRQSLRNSLDQAAGAARPEAVWELAKIYWHTFLQPASMTAIDFHGTEGREQILQMSTNGEIGRNAMLYVLLRKPAEHQQFRIPMQGIYADNISADAKDAWYKLR